MPCGDEFTVASGVLIRLFRNADAKITISLFNKADGKPFNLTGITASKLILPKADGTLLELAGVTVSIDCGVLRFTLSKANSLLLMLGLEADDSLLTAELELTISGETVVKQFEKSTEVKDRLLPAA